MRIHNPYTPYTCTLSLLCVCVCVHTHSLALSSSLNNLNTVPLYIGRMIVFNDILIF